MMFFCRPAAALWWGVGIVLMTGRVLAANPASEALVKEGNAAFKNGDRPGAVRKFTEAIAADGSNVIAYYNRGRIQEVLSNFDEAYADYNALLRLKPDHLQGLFLRGDMNLRTGRFAESIADYDLSLQLSPKLEVRHWKRGVAYYFAGRYEDGRRQFEKCRTAETNDVENALWHFACVARSQSVDKARAALFSVTRDPRLPMVDVLLQLHAVYAGTTKPEELLAATPGMDATVEKATDRAIYVSFFLGLFYEVTGQPGKALEVFEKTDRLTKRGHNFGDLARLRVAAAKKPAAHP
jgi:lipoprotein NlpI